MELIDQTHKASKVVQEDFISNMPDNIVTNVLDRLPLQDAVKTGILSRNWKLKWTMLNRLVFDEKFFSYLAQTKDDCDHVRIISMLLLRLKGPITKFVLSIDEECYSTFDKEDITHWILFLSSNEIKDLTLWKRTGLPLKLPTNLFSSLELKHLRLINCSLVDSLTNFHGFPNLMSLEFDIKLIRSIQSGELITRCPLLEILNMRLPHQHILHMELSLVRKLKFVEISKPANIKILYLSLCFLEDLIIAPNSVVANSSTIFEVVGSFPKLENLHLDFTWCELAEGDANKTFPTVFPCLKALKLSNL